MHPMKILNKGEQLYREGMGERQTERKRESQGCGPIHTANPIRRPSPKKATRNATQIIHRDDASLMKSICDSAIGEPNTDCFNVSWRGVDTAHDTLVIALEEYADEGEGLYGEIELLG